MRSDVEYYVELTKAGTGERHHCRKSLMPEYAVSHAGWLMRELRRGGGTVWRNHHGWCDTVEVWEIHDGDHDERTGPDRRIAWVSWDGPEDLAIIEDFAVLRGAVDRG